MSNRISLLGAILGIPVLLGSLCTTPEPGPPDAGAYHTYAELTADLQSLQSQYPQIAMLSEIGTSVENRKIWALKISDNVAQEEDEAEVLFIGGHHAREWVSVDVPLLLAQHLLQNYQSDAGVKQLVDNGQIWIVPLLNPDGHQYTVTADRLWRKNRRNNGDGSFGVDLNRNYSYEWGGPGSSGSTYSETYRGTEAFSEPETQAIRDLAVQHNFVAMLSYHSYSQLVLYPWGYTYSPAPDEALMDQMANAISDSIRGVHGQTYVPEASSDLYLASGDATDWLYGERRSPSFTIELRPRSASPGFLLPDNQLLPTFEENLPAALYLIQWTQTVGKMTTTM